MKTPQEIIQALIDIGTGKIPHLYMGGCPDAVDGHDRRYKRCEACNILIEAEKLTLTNQTKCKTR